MKGHTSINLLYIYMKKIADKIQRCAFEWIEELAIAITVAIIIFTFFFKVVEVNGISMFPTLESGDKLIVSIIDKSYDVGDIIVISEVLDQPIIKRIIATEGQVVDIDEDTGTVYINGDPLDEAEFGIENGITTEIITSEDKTEFPITVPEGCVFVLGDNRTVSEDSRFVSVGMVDTRNIIGTAVVRFMPLDNFWIIN